MDLPYYHGPLSKQDCETLLLKERVDGNYLLRDSESVPGVLCLCVSWVALTSTHMLSVGLISRWKRNCASLNSQPKWAEWEIARHCHEEWKEQVCLSSSTFPSLHEQTLWSSRSGAGGEDKASGSTGREQRDREGCHVRKFLSYRGWFI